MTLCESCYLFTISLDFSLGSIFKSPLLKASVSPSVTHFHLAHLPGWETWGCFIKANTSSEEERLPQLRIFRWIYYRLWRTLLKKSAINVLNISYSIRISVRSPRVITWKGNTHLYTSVLAECKILSVAFAEPCFLKKKSVLRLKECFVGSGGLTLPLKWSSMRTETLSYPIMNPQGLKQCLAHGNTFRHICWFNE